LLVSDGPLLHLRAIRKRFPGVLALDDVDFTLRAGEIHALMGENGAGKSTLIKVLTGVYERDAGAIELQGQPIQPRSPADAQALGISTVYQEVNLIPDLSIAENLFLGRQPRRLGFIRWREMRREARRALQRLDLSLDVSRPLNTFSIAIQQMVAIARALDVSARVLILDEPTSSLDRGEVGQLFEVMRRLKSEGLGLIFITHFLDQVYTVADRITVLRNGRRVGEYEAARLPQLELVSHMVGRPVETLDIWQRQHAPTPATASPQDRKEPAPSKRAPVLEALEIGRRGWLEPCTVSIWQGEIVGLAGLLGSGRTELASLLVGLRSPDLGLIRIEGNDEHITSPSRALRLGVVYLPEDRKSQGIVPDLSVRENMILSLQGRRGWRRLLSRKEQEDICDRFIRDLRIATPDREKPAGELSGGNQQKVVLARLLLADPKVLLLDEPTRGIDVGAKAEIEALVRDLCGRGIAILFISGELEEVARNSDRVVILRDRKKIAELSGDAVDLDTILGTIAVGEEAGNEH